MKSGPNPPPLPLSYRISHAVMGPLLKMLGLTCRTAYELSSEQMDRELSFGEAFRLRVHLLICRVCRRLPAQFRGLRELVRRTREPDPEEPSDERLPPEVKTRIVESLNHNSRNQP